MDVIRVRSRERFSREFSSLKVLLHVRLEGIEVMREKNLRALGMEFQERGWEGEMERRKCVCVCVCVFVCIFQSVRV